MRHRPVASALAGALIVTALLGSTMTAGSASTTRAGAGGAPSAETAAAATGGAGGSSSSASGGGGNRSKVDHSIALLDRVIKGATIDQATLSRAKSASKPIHAIVQLHKLPEAGDLDTLSALGIEPLSYLNAPSAAGSAYLASVSPKVRDGDARFSELVRAVQPLLSVDKVDVGLATADPASTAGVVVFFADVAPSAAASVLAKHGVRAAGDGQSSTYHGTLSRSQVKALAKEDAVQFIAQAPEIGQLDLDVSRGVLNVDDLQQLDVASGT
jgi:hypothetical protein